QAPRDRDAPRSGRTQSALLRRGAIAVQLKNRQRPTLPGPCEPSTIGAEGLNCSVRNGKRCFPLAKATGNRRDRSPGGVPGRAERPSSVPQNCTVATGYHKNPSSPRPISTGLLQTSPSF